MCALLSQGNVQLCVPVLFLLVAQEIDIRIRLFLSKGLLGESALRVVSLEVDT